jgi:integrase
MLKVKEKSSKPKDLTLTQFSVFIDALRNRVMGTPYEAIYYLAKLQYGIYGRTQEAAALTVEDFDIVKMRVTIQRKVIWPRAKNQKSFIKEGLKASRSKTLPLSEFAHSVLKEWTLRSGVRTGYLFAKDGVPLEYRQIEYRYTQALKDAGLPFKATYLLRHASLSEHYKTGKDIVATKTAAGHTALSSTQRYVKTRDEDMRLIQTNLDKRMNESVGS